MGDRIEVVIEQPDGGRALVIGKINKVPEAAGGLALQTVVSDSTITPLPRCSLLQSYAAYRFPELTALPASGGSPQS